MIFRRYEIRSRSLISGEDIVSGVHPERFFFQRNAKEYCNMANLYRLLYGAKAFEHYVADRREDV